jgi:hypothetical protein
MSVQLAEAIADILRDEGYRPTLKGEDIAFKVEGMNFWYETFGDDTTYARLLLAFSTTEDTSADTLRRVANDLNLEIKAVKTVIPSDGVLFTVEQFFDEPGHLRPVLARAIAAARSASDRFFEKLDESEKAVGD